MDREGRTSSGQFAPGFRGGPGRPKGSVDPRRADYLAAMAHKVPLEQWEKIVATAVDQSIAGDKDARIFLGNYLIGKPATAPMDAAPSTNSLMLDFIMPVILKALDRYPEAKIELAAALGQLGIESGQELPVEDSAAEPPPPSSKAISHARRIR